MRIERLRVWLLASAGLLLVVIAGFIGTARYLRRHLWSVIPQKLGANVKVDSSGVTVSHTYQGQTDYVVHAAKEVEHTDGKVALHDVWIKLCGGQQRRADMVRGDEWEWDQKMGVIRALGVAHIELRAATGKPGCAAVDDSASADTADAKTLRVTTSDLIFMQKLGVAATSAPIDFESGAMQGHAVGADYASDTGTLMLHSAVSMKGVSAGQPVQVDAASAELDGQQRVVRLRGARYRTGAGDAARTATAEQAVLHLREDQTLERIEAQGNVTMQAGGGTVSSAKADVAMNAAGHPVSALLSGGVRYGMSTVLAERHSEAQETAIKFDGRASPQAQHIVLTGAAHIVEKTRADAARTVWNSRELSAAKVDVALAPGADGKNEVRDAEAFGGARFSEVNAATGTGGRGAATGPATTEIAADDLKAHFAAATGEDAGSRPQLETVSGRGHTLVRQVDAAGVEQTSAGDSLDAKFRSSSAGGAKGKVARGGEGGLANTDALASAIQTGHVVITRRDTGKGAKSEADVERGTAQQAIYDGDADTMTLAGGVQLTDAGSHLWANQVVLENATKNAHATGAVKVEYAQSSGAISARSKGQAGGEPVHVLAERADLDRATDVVTFHGAPARMWRGGSQVQAPAIEMDRSAKRLIARGESAALPGAEQVHTVLMNESDDANAGKAVPATARECAANPGGGKPNEQRAQSQTIRIASGGLAYSQALNEADFTGGFRAETSDGAGVTTIRANDGTVYLKSTKAASRVQNSGAAPSLAGSIDRVVANRDVTVDQPGLRATGERLVYTAADEALLLTGDAKRPPRATDGRGNVTTGAALEFHRACGGAGGDTVEVLNKVPGGLGIAAGGIHTEVRTDAKGEQPAR